MMPPFSRHRLPARRLRALITILVCCIVLGGLVLAGCASPDAATAPAPAATAAGALPSGTRSPTAHPRAGATSRSSASPRPAGAAGSGSAAARITFLDVGQGDSILLQIGGWTGLVDGGPSAAGSRLVADLRSHGVRHIDTLVVTHPHADHIGGLPAVVGAFAVGKAVIDEAYDSSSYRSLVSALRARHVPIVHWWRGASERFGAATAQVLSPGPSPPDADPNDDSIVLLVTVGARRLLLAGDVGGGVEDAIAAAYHGPPVYVLKVGHHGSSGSTGDALLSAMRPAWAVIEVGPNSYGHPSPAAVARLRARHVRIFTTWRSGDITLLIAASGAVHWRWAGAGPGVGSGTSSSAGASSNTTGTSGDPIVYITATGEKYHRAGCRYLSQSKIAVRLSDAKSQGYTPCSVCDPPR